MRSVSRRWLVLLALAGVLVAACSSDEPAVTVWNETRMEQGFDPSADRQALALLRRLDQRGVSCTAAQAEDFDALVTSYRRARLPLPRGSASCTGPGGENVLVEVFNTGKYPTGADFIARKRELLCAKGFELGARPDGTNDFEGIPYVAARSGGWIVEPDSVALNRRIAAALDLDPRNGCPASSRG